VSLYIGGIIRGICRICRLQRCVKRIVIVGSLRFVEMGLVYKNSHNFVYFYKKWSLFGRLDYDLRS